MTLQTKFGNPMLALNDGRDLLCDISQGKWRVGLKLYDLIQMLPGFIQKVEKLESLRFFGQFHFQLYAINKW